MFWDVRMRLMTAFAVAAIVVSLASGCGDVNAALEKVAEGRRIAADLTLQFTKSADAANRAVMADSDEQSVAFAHESEQATTAVQSNVAALQPILQGLRYEREAQLLEEFERRFAKYHELDRTILDLAVENSNLKAQRLSFGAGQQEADAFAHSLEALAPSSPTDASRVDALVAQAISSVREIQVLQAPHIAEAGEETMGRIEQRMKTAETAARGGLAALGKVTRSASGAQLAGATAALDRFVAVNAQILALSHRNTNVRSLALSLDQKRPLTTACEETLRTLQDALAKRGVTTGK
jgi:Four helix bundle sensory module for signal transduction